MLTKVGKVDLLGEIGFFDKSLTSASAAIGANACSAVATRIEEAAMKKNTAAVNEYLKQLYEIFETLTGMLTKRIKSL